MEQGKLHEAKVFNCKILIIDVVVSITMPANDF